MRRLGLSLIVPLLRGVAVNDAFAGGVAFEPGIRGPSSITGPAGETRPADLVGIMTSGGYLGGDGAQGGAISLGGSGSCEITGVTTAGMTAVDLSDRPASCEEASDCNGGGLIDLADATCGVARQLTGGPPPPAPFPGGGREEDADEPA